MICAKCGRQLNGGICSCGYDHGVEAVLYLTMPSETLQLTNIVAEMEIVDGVLVRYHGTAREVVVPEGVREIGKHAFSTKPVERVMLPSTVTKLDTWAFYRCSSLREINLPAGLQEIGSWAFDGCTALQEITIPEWANMSAWTFRGCTALERVTFLPEFKSIGTYAFQNCTALREVTIPDSVIFISQKAFEGCGEIRVIASDWWKQNYPALLSLIERTQTAPTVQNYIAESQQPEVLSGTEAPQTNHTAESNGLHIINGILVGYRGNAREVVVPGTVREISSNAFRGCSSLQQLRLENGIEKIGSYAFAECDSLRSVRIPGSVRVIDAGAFENCSELETVVLDRGVQEIRTNAFRNCRFLRLIVLPRTVNRIGESVFSGSPVKVVAEYGMNQPVRESFRTGGRPVERLPDNVTVHCEHTQFGCGNITVDAPLHWRLTHKKLLRILEGNERE